MKVCEGRSYNTGIDFKVLDEDKQFIVKSHLVIKSTTPLIISPEVSIVNKLTSNKQHLKWRMISYFSVVVYFIFVYLMYIAFKPHLVNDTSFFMKLLFLYIVFMFGFLEWFSYQVWYFCENSNTLRFHMAAHMVINYYNKHKELPKTLEDFVSASPINNKCIMTLFPCLVSFWCMSLSVLVLFKNIWAISILFVTSAIVTIYLYKKEKFDFLQRVLFENVSIREAEVALLGLQKCIELKQESKRS